MTYYFLSRINFGSVGSKETEMSFSSTASASDIKPNEFNAERKRKDSTISDVEVGVIPR